MKEKKTVIITGANSGLGYACTELIAAKREEYRIIMGCRDEQRAQKAKEELVGKTGNEDIVTFPLNLASVSDRIDSLENSSKALAALMTGAEYKNATGQCFDRSTEAASSSPLSYNKENAAELWAKSICLVKNNHNKDGD